MQSGDSVLHICCREGLLATAQTLCAFGCAVDVANSGGGNFPVHLASRGGHIEIVRCLALAGCKTDAKNSDGVTPDLEAIANGHGEVSDLLRRLKRDACCDEYIEQLIPSHATVSKIKLKVFGKSAAGKSSLIESLKAGYLSSLFRRSRRSSSGRGKATRKGTQMSLIMTNAYVNCILESASNGGAPPSSSTCNSKPDVIHEQYTKGIEVQQVGLIID